MLEWSFHFPSWERQLTPWSLLYTQPYYLFHTWFLWSSFPSHWSPLSSSKVTIPFSWAGPKRLPFLSLSHQLVFPWWFPFLKSIVLTHFCKIKSPPSFSIFLPRAFACIHSAPFDSLCIFPRDFDITIMYEQGFCTSKERISTVYSSFAPPPISLKCDWTLWGKDRPWWYQRYPLCYCSSLLWYLWESLRAYVALRTWSSSSFLGEGAFLGAEISLL